MAFSFFFGFFSQAYSFSQCQEEFQAYQQADSEWKQISEQKCYVKNAFHKYETPCPKQSKYSREAKTKKIAMRALLRNCQKEQVLAQNSQKNQVITIP